jgi:hypothetical protein
MRPLRFRRSVNRWTRVVIAAAALAVAGIGHGLIFSNNEPAQPAVKRGDIAAGTPASSSGRSGGAGGSASAGGGASAEMVALHENYSGDVTDADTFFNGGSSSDNTAFNVPAVDCAVFGCHGSLPALGGDFSGTLLALDTTEGSSALEFLPPGAGPLEGGPGGSSDSPLLQGGDAPGTGGIGMGGGTSGGTTGGTSAAGKGGGAGDVSNVTAPVPEPGTYALMVGGLLLVAGVLRRRRDEMQS